MFRSILYKWDGPTVPACITHFALVRTLVFLCFIDFVYMMPLVQPNASPECLAASIAFLISIIFFLAFISNLGLFPQLTAGPVGL